MNVGAVGSTPVPARTIVSTADAAKFKAVAAAAAATARRKKARAKPNVPSAPAQAGAAKDVSKSTFSIRA